MTEPTATPYGAAGDLLRDLIRATRTRLQAVKDAQADSLEPITWPPAMLALEAEIDRRMAVSDPELVPMCRLRQRVGLSDTELRILWILIAHERDPLSRRLLRAIATEEVSDPTTDVLWRAVYNTFDVASEEELRGDGLLRGFGFIERADPSAGSGTLERQTWKASDRVRALAYGVTALDTEVKKLVSDGAATALDLELAGNALEAVRRACAGEDFVIVHGPVGSGRRSALMLALWEHRVLLIEGRSISKERDQAARELRTIARECAVFGYTPLIRNLDALGASGQTPDRIDLVEDELRRVSLIAATANEIIARTWKRHAENIALRPLPTDRRATLWQRAIPTLTQELALEHAARYPIAPALIHAVGAHATASHARPNDEDIRAAIRSTVANRLGGHAKQITITQTWDDLILPDDQAFAIAELIARIRHRATVNTKWGFAPDPEAKGQAVAALFSGPPGTGKTMTAGLIAQALGVDLYQVDISKITSKYIGETEKNLAEIFDAADGAHAVLLFDEADSLFGKRTDVRTSVDRYANMEVNFLLQRVESFTGIVILTTNLDTAIDPAFRRRLTHHVRFPMPEADERLKILRRLIPSTAPTEGRLDLETLAKDFAMSGGHLYNTVRRAAYLAAQAGKVLNAQHLARAIRQEYEDMGNLTSRK